MKTYERDRVFLERVAESLRAAGRSAEVADTGGGVVIVPAGGEAPGHASWYCGTDVGGTWAGSLIDEVRGEPLGREFETDVPSEGDDAEAAARAVLYAVRLEEAVPDAPEDYVAKVARRIGEDARTVTEHGTPGGAMDEFLESARGQIARAFEEGYRRALAETWLWREDRERRLVWARLPSRGRRVSALRVATAAGLVRLWAFGCHWTLPCGMVSRPRRNGEARVIRERLLGELRAYQAAAESLSKASRRRRLR